MGADELRIYADTALGRADARCRGIKIKLAFFVDDARVALCGLAVSVKIRLLSAFIRVRQLIFRS